MRDSRASGAPAMDEGEGAAPGYDTAVNMPRLEPSRASLEPEEEVAPPSAAARGMSEPLRIEVPT